MFFAYFTMGLLMFVGFLLMVIILLQRGRGGGLAGAFGGAGGASAFGTRAGDVFTKITAIMAIVWVLLAAGNRFVLESASNSAASAFAEDDLPDEEPSLTPGETPGETPAEEEPE